MCGTATPPPFGRTPPLGTVLLFVSPAMGFTWDNANVLNEVTAVRNVRGKYANALECGSIDPAEALPAFLEELETAGANTIIEEKQKQLDEYLASKE